MTLKGKRRGGRPTRDGDDPWHLEQLRKCPCCVCGEPAPVTVHHLKTGRHSSRVAPDRYALPLCQFKGDYCHDRIEAAGTNNEVAWFALNDIDPFVLAEQLWTVTRAARKLGEDPLPSLRAAIILHRKGAI